MRSGASHVFPKRGARASMPSLFPGVRGLGTIASTPSRYASPLSVTYHRGGAPPLLDPPVLPANPSTRNRVSSRVTSTVHSRCLSFLS